MGRFSTGTYTLKHPEKYVGESEPKFKSSWELSFMRLCDENPGVIQWAYEPLKIPYINPVLNKKTIYVPDFLVNYRNRKGRTRTEIVEIKPKREASLKEARTKVDKAKVNINQAKWTAAREFCRINGIGFRVLTEDQLYTRPSRRKR